MIKDGDVYLVGCVKYLVHNNGRGLKLYSEYSAKYCEENDIKNVLPIIAIKKYNGIRIGNYKEYKAPFYYRKIDKPFCRI